MSNHHTTDRSRTLEPNEIHNVLRNERRRQALEYLGDSDEVLTVDKLAEHIASLETGESPPPHDVRKSVYVSLHQTHLPKLDELGIVEYDLRSKELSLTELAKEVEVYMEVVPESAISWDLFYLGLSVLAVTTLTGFRIGIPFIVAPGLEFWAWFYFLLFGCSSIYHLWEKRRGRLSL